jgi:hypothetical protein
VIRPPSPKAWSRGMSPEWGACAECSTALRWTSQDSRRSLPTKTRAQPSRSTPNGEVHHEEARGCNRRARCMRGRSSGRPRCVRSRPHNCPHRSRRTRAGKRPACSTRISPTLRRADGAACPALVSRTAGDWLYRASKAAEWHNHPLGGRHDCR